MQFNHQEYIKHDEKTFIEYIDNVLKKFREQILIGAQSADFRTTTIAINSVGMFETDEGCKIGVAIAFNAMQVFDKQPAPENIKVDDTPEFKWPEELHDVPGLH